MSKIVKLSEQLSNMIAAGEVVEKPMGVVKELVENSLDAGATMITVNIEEGGIQSIEVVDNGCGMDQQDAVNAFGRHATSKIKEVDDLWSIGTLGFRGEAIPSIASVSKFEMITSDGNENTRVVVEYGKMVEARPYPAQQGTRIKVEGLFIKTPARLKHLKSVSNETNAIVDVMEKFAMSYPSVSFTLNCDGVERIYTTGSGQLEEIMYKIYGKEAATQAVPLDFQNYDFHVTGSIVLPHVTRATKYYMTIFINGRMVRNYSIYRAIQEGYKDFIAPERFPIAILDIRMDYRLADVNVHPSKWEIRLSKEKELCELIRSTIAKVLQEKLRTVEMNLKPAVPKTKVDVLSFMDQLDEPVVTVNTKETVKPLVREEYVPYEPVVTQVPTNDKPEVQKQEEKEERFPAMTVIGQLWGKYILAQADDGLYIIDQHAAQEKCNYEMFLRSMNEQDVMMQDLLVPVVLELTNANMARLDELNDMLKDVQIELERFGSKSVCIRSVPVWMTRTDHIHFLQDLIDEIDETSRLQTAELRKHQIATRACKFSIKFNRYLNMTEMEKVISDLRECPKPFQCPHGRPTVIKLTEHQLEKEFKRV